MNRTAEKLAAYRREARKKSDDIGVDNARLTPGDSPENNRGSGDGRSPGIRPRLNIDVLDVPPFCTWRRCYESHPRSTLLITALLYLVGQIYFVWVQFGLVFFVASILLAICLSLGNRAEGELEWRRRRSESFAGVFLVVRLSCCNPSWVFNCCRTSLGCRRILFLIPTVSDCWDK